MLKKLILICLFLTINVANSFAATSISARIKHNFARITFAWDERVHFKTNISGSNITLKFTKSIDGDIAIIKRNLPYIKNVKLSKDKKSIIITTDKKYKIRNFISSNASGIDILGVNVSIKQPIKIAKTVNKTKNTAKIPPKTIKKEDKEKLVKKELVREKPAKKKTKDKIILSKNIPKKNQEYSNTTKNHNKKMFVRVRNGKRSSEFYFPWKKRTASAVFFRGNNLWIVFNRKTNIYLKALNSILPPFIEKLEKIEDKNNTILILKTNKSLYANAYKSRNSHEWVVSVTRRSHIPTFTITTEIKTKPPLKPHVFINSLETAKQIKIKAKNSGDILDIIPIYRSGEGIFPARHFVDFNMTRTSQGIVIEAFNDKLRIVKTRNGLKITTRNGLQLSKNIPPLDVAEFIKKEQKSQTLFPYKDWKSPDWQAFTTSRQKLERNIISANSNKQPFYRLQLGKLYIAEGLYQESLGIFNRIEQENPEFYSDYQVAALKGAANFMINRIDLAMLDFSHPSLADEDEVELWKRESLILLGNKKKPIDFLSYDKQYAQNYTADIRRRLAIIAADQAVSLGKYNTTLRILDSLAADELLEPVKDYADYLIGKIYLNTDKINEARDIFENLVINSKSRFVAVRAEYSLSSLLYRYGEITKTELVERLARLQIVWRGDALEKNILNTMGDLYKDDGQYKNALRAWREILTYFINAPESIEVAEKMSNLFKELYNDNLADNLSPLKALAIYYEFRELTPIGKEGDRMIQALADRLVAVDLLSRAASLLEHQIKYRLKGEDRSLVGSHLALIYLLNREPQKALEALERSGYGNNDSNLQKHRNHLAANAYLDMGEIKSAINILHGDYSIDAKMIRLDIYWENTNWKEIIKVAENILASRNKLSENLSDMEVQTLLRLAIAYVFENEKEQLRYLRDYFPPLIKDERHKKQLLFITNDDGKVTNKNITNLSKNLENIRYFLNNYKTRIKNNGLSSVK